MPEKMRVVWRSGVSFRSDCEAAHKLIEVERKKNGGDVTPEQVVALAKPAHSPIHADFLWDDAAAAEAHRRETARNMLRSIVVVDVLDASRNMRRYETAIIEAPAANKRATKVYRTLEDVMKNPDTRAATLNRLWGDLLNLQKKMRLYKEFARIVKVIDDESDRQNSG